MAGQAGAKERSTIVVRNALAARQWELHLCAQRIAGGERAWETPPVVSYSAWLDELWLEHAQQQGPALTANQSSALWRRVIAESEESNELIGHAGAAEWAAGGWQLLHRWQIDAAEQRAAAAQVDYRAFLSWARRYRAWLDGHGCVDRAELEAALAAHATIHGRVVVADLAEQYPARATLLAQLAARGAAIEDHAVPDAAGSRFSARLADTADELRAAFAWARRRLEREPSTRVAIVIPTPARRQDEIERLAAAELGELAPELVWTQGSSLAREPAIGAACEALTLGAAYAPYAAFGRWLRSPFFAATRVEPFARARLDAELRGGLMAQLPFQAAYRCGVKELLEQRAPESARSLASALAALGTLRRATPSRWAHVASRFLVELGWQPPSKRAALLGWQSALDELARLTPIVGEVSLERALADLKRLLEGTAMPALPVRGIHVLARIEDVGPGYHAVWATGFTDAAWPEAPRGNPLLPLALQRAHRMPYSSPSDAQERSAGALERLVRRCPELVVSWPARVFDYETEPSPAIADWPMLAAAELDRPAAARAVQRAARETLDDAAPPFAGSRVPGGTGALGRQARCPLRALCQDRLGARPLEALGLGVPARLRGIATHRAAEALLADAPAQSSLAARLTEVPANADRALARLFGRSRSYLGAFYELEADLLRRVLTALLREELLRAPFRVRGVEQSVVAALGPLTFNVRIDRIDELADGTLAIIDYKTGDRATSADWFGERLRDAQVPLYATQSSSPVRAAVVARLSPEQTKYSGFWPGAAFPGRPSKGAHPNAEAQLELWRTQLAQLAAELAAGDARIFIDDYDDAAGDYAPLTRVFEQLALARGAVARW